MRKALSFGPFLFVCVISAVAVRGYAAGIDPQFAAGNTLLDSLPPVPEGKTEKSYFEVQLNRRAVGIGEVTLGCRRADNGLVYDYRHHLAVKLPTNVLMTVDIQAVLTPKFQPLAIDVQRSMTLPDGQAFTGTQSMTIEGNKIVLQSNEGDVKSTREFSVPNVHFVYAMDAFIPRMEKKQKKPFALYNFDMESGGLAEIHCQWIVNEQRKEQLSVSKDRGKTVDEYYLFEFSGNYLGYGKMDPPFLEIKTTETQQAEVKKLLGLE
jgi:hypothetical protein